MDIKLKKKLTTMVINTNNSSIEAEEAKMECRKFLQRNRPPFRHIKLKTTVYPFKLNIYGIATIEKELNPKKAQECKESCLNLNESIQGESIKGFTSDKKPNIKLINATSSHKGTSIKTNSFTFASIEIPVRYLLQKKESDLENDITKMI